MEKALEYLRTAIEESDYDEIQILSRDYKIPLNNCKFHVSHLSEHLNWLAVNEDVDRMAHSAACSQDHSTPLHAAISNKNPYMVQYLLNLDADPNCEDGVR